MKYSTALLNIVLLTFFAPSMVLALAPSVVVDNDQILEQFSVKNRTVACYEIPNQSRRIGYVISTLDDKTLMLSPISLDTLKFKLNNYRALFKVNAEAVLKNKINKLRQRLKSLRQIITACNQISSAPDVSPSPNPSPTASPGESPSPTASATPTVTATPTSTPSTFALCADGIDNDGDGLIDGADIQCQRFPYIEFNPALHPNGSLVDGWTVFEPSIDSRIVYVSSSAGSDSNNGLSSSTPKRTIEAAALLLRNGLPDWMLLKRGDTFGGIEGNWKAGGRSRSEPAIISGYGQFSSPRPLIQSAGSEGLRISAGGGAPAVMSFLMVADLRFSAYPRDTFLQNPTGIRVQKADFDYFHLEGCDIGDYSTGIVIQYTGDEITNSILRRNVIHDSRAGGGLNAPHAQGIYTDEVRNLLIEENVVDRNGGTAGDPMANEPDIFKHNMYIQADGHEVTIKNNIVARGSSHGIQLRPGGTLEGNLVFDNPINVLVAGASGEFSSVRRNVILDPSPFINPDNPRGDNLHLENLNGIEVLDNVILHSNPTTSGGMLDFSRGNEGYSMLNASIRDNIFYGGGRILDIPDFSGLTFENVTFIGNHFQQVLADPPREIVRVANVSQLSEIGGMNNRYFSLAPTNEWSRLGGAYASTTSYLSTIGDTTSTVQQVAYPAPQRDVTSYARSLGLESSIDFLEAARGQSKESWNHEYSAQAAASFIRQGFGLTGP